LVPQLRLRARAGVHTFRQERALAEQRRVLGCAPRAVQGPWWGLLSPWRQHWASSAHLQQNALAPAALALTRAGSLAAGGYPALRPPQRSTGYQGARCIFVEAQPQLGAELLGRPHASCAALMPRARAARSIKPYTVVKQLVTVVIGIIVGLLAVSLTLATEGVTTWKNHRVRAIIHADAFAPRPTLGFALGVLFHMGFSGALALAGAGVVRARRCGRGRAARVPRNAG